VNSGTDEASELGSHEMNFLPRSVAMGNSTNKFVKLHVKFESGKETFSVPPDLSVGVLKEQIAAKFQVPVSQLVLSCNGKPLVGEEGRSLRQARVCSGSKVLAARAGARQEAVVQGPTQPRDQEEEQRRGQIRREVEAGEREQELVTRLVAVEQQTAELVQEVARVRGEQEDLAVGRRAAKVAGEKLMRLLESLDNLALDRDMVELRARRKKAASRINKVMDKNESNLQAITDALEWKTGNGRWNGMVAGVPGEKGDGSEGDE